MGLDAVARAPGVVLFALVLLGAESHAADPADIIGETRVHRIASDETLLDVARDNGLGYVELIAANPGTDPWLPGRRERRPRPSNRNHRMSRRRQVGHARRMSTWRCSPAAT